MNYRIRHMAAYWMIISGIVGCGDRDVGRLDPIVPGAGPNREGQATPDQSANGPLFPPGPAEHDFPHLHNLLRVSDRIYSGGEPVGEEAFAELAQLGIRTVVSVDGARPDIQSAERHGLRYVHIPIGYDGIFTDAGRMLRRLVQDAEAPFYIHCHHGVHRGPAAAAIACVAEGIVSGPESLAILEKAGTSRGYAGLWRDVHQYVAPAAGAELPDLVAVAEVRSLAAAMALLDRAADNLKLCQSVGWKAPAEHPDLVYTQEALLLHEGFRETMRQLEDSSNFDQPFLDWMRESDERSRQLLGSLQAGDYESADGHFTLLLQQCWQCHIHYRD